MKKDFLDIIDHSGDELKALIDLAIDLKKEYFSSQNAQIGRASCRERV